MLLKLISSARLKCGISFVRPHVCDWVFFVIFLQG